MNENVNMSPVMTPADMSPEELAQQIMNNMTPDKFMEFMTIVQKSMSQATAQQKVAQQQQPTLPQPPVYQPLQTPDQEAVIRDVVDGYIEANRHLLILPNLMANSNKICYRIRDDIMQNFKTAREGINSTLAKGQSQVKDYQSFPPFIVARLLIGTGEVKRMAAGTNSKGCKLIMKHYFRNASTNGQYKWSGQWMFIDSGENETSDALAHIFNAMCPTSNNGFAAMMTKLKQETEIVYLRKDNTLTFWRNGVYDLANKRFMGYDDPDYEKTYGKYITLRKCHTNHPLGKPWGTDPVCKIDPATGKAIEPVITMPDGTEWHAMEGLTIPFNIGTPVGDASLKVILQGAQFMLRGTGGIPGMFHFWINHGGSGSNGKGFLADLLARIVQKARSMFHDGDEDLSTTNAVGHLSVDKMGEKFNLDEKALSWCMNVAGETNSTQEGKKIEDAALLKSLSRKEYVTIQGKFEKAMEICLDYVWWIQHANQMPQINEKNNSSVSCILAIPFEKTLGRSKPFIKDDYIQREEVASYYAWYITCECPMWEQYDEDALNTLAPYKNAMLENSMNTLQFFKEYLKPQTTELDIIPVELAYDCYLGWCEKNHFKYTVNMNTFIRDGEQFGANNNMGIGFTKKRARITSKDRADMTRVITSLAMWGYTMKGGRKVYSDFQQHTVNGEVPSHMIGRLASVMVESNNATTGYREGKVFNRGAFVRKTSHWEKPNDETEEEEILEYEFEGDKPRIAG